MLVVSKFEITPLQYYGKNINLYVSLYDIMHTKFNNQIITGIKTNLCNGTWDSIANLNIM